MQRSGRQLASTLSEVFHWSGRSAVPPLSPPCKAHSPRLLFWASRAAGPAGGPVERSGEQLAGEPERWRERDGERRRERERVSEK